MTRATSAYASLTLATAGLAAACSSGSAATQPWGPVYGFDASGDAVTDHVPDAHAGVDAPVDAPADARVDRISAFQTDAGDAHAPTDATVPRDGGKDATSHEASAVPDAHHEASDASHPSDTSHRPDSSRPVDASDAAHARDARPETSSDAGACPSGSGTIAIVGGTLTAAFGWISTNGVVSLPTTFPTPSIAAAPAVVPFAGGFLGAFASSNNDVIESVLYSSGWATPVAVPALAGKDASATELGAPALAVLGQNAEIVYAGTNTYFYHGVYSGGAWSPASDPVGGAGSAQDFGASAPTAAVSSGVLFVAYDGKNNGLYIDYWQSGAWAGPGGVQGAGVGTVAPTMIPITSESADLLLVYEDQSSAIHSVVHPAAAAYPAANWSTPVAVSGASTLNAVSLAPLAGGGAVMAFLGEDQHPYASVFTPGTTPAWSAPVETYANAHTLEGPPTVATGVCGFDAVMAIVEETVGVELLTLKGTTWSTPVLVSGTSAATCATVATSP